MTIFSSDDIIELLKKKEKITTDVSFDIGQNVSKMFRNGNENTGREIVIRVLDAWEYIPVETHQYWNDIIESSGLYPYLKDDLLGVTEQLRKEFHKSKHLQNIYFHEEQKNITELFESGVGLVVSAPTSFGKSLLIEEVVARNEFNNIVIIQPTLALLDETRKKLQKYKTNYNIILSTFQKPLTTKNNLFLLTAERFVQYEDLPKVDFFVIDEFYKLSTKRSDDRAITLNHALYRLIKDTKRFFLLGPSIKSVSPAFLRKVGAEWVGTQFSTVAIDIETLNVSQRRNAEAERRGKLYQLLKKLKEPTLIYCASPEKSSQLAKEFIDSLDDKTKYRTNENEAINEWIKENISEKWTLIEALRHRVAFHHGALPRHLGSSIVDAFNLGTVKYLFCTSTLIEGVNTVAKNVILFDKRKGIRSIDYFDYRNIIGRSGRMTKYFVGKVYQFYNEPEQLQIEVDVPAFSDSETPLELLVQLDEKDRKKSRNEDIEDFENLDDDVKAVLKKNHGVSIKGQLRIIETIESDLKKYNKLLNWNRFPKFDELEAVISLAWENLLQPGESRGGVFKPRQLTVQTINYSTKKSIRGMIESMASSNFWREIEPNESVRIQKIIHSALQSSRHWFEYKLPRLLTVISELQRFVFAKNGYSFGDYSYYATQLESFFLPTNLALLREYGVPVSAINKLKRHISEDQSSDLIFSALRKLDLKKIGLIDYEASKIQRLF